MNIDFAKSASIGTGVLLTGLLQASGTAYAQTTFEGLYLGGHAGAGGPNSNGTFDGIVAPLEGITQNGFIGGGQIGWNFQDGIWVYGIEGDLSAIDWGKGFVDEDGDSHSLDTNLFATVRGRFGRLYDNSLIFVTGGVAFFEGEGTFDVGGAGPGFIDITAVGGVLGAGIETKLTEEFSVKIEGLWGIFGDSTNLDPLPDGALGDNLTIDDAFLARIGFNWHLNASGTSTHGSESGSIHELPHDWNGLYLGANVGIGGIGPSGVWDNAGSNADLEGLSDNGFLGGGQVGWNVQTGDYVYGIEGDISFADWDGSIGPDGEGDTHTFDMNYFATVRGRAGMVYGNSLLYGTAGVAIVDADATFEIGSTPGSVGIDAVGFVGGIGLETFVQDNVSVKAEALYMAFDESPNLGAVPDFDPGDNLSIDDGFVFRMGINWHTPN